MTRYTRDGMTMTGSRQLGLAANSSNNLNQIMAMDDYKKAMAQVNYELFPGNPEALEKFHIAEIEKWGRLIKNAKIEAQ